MACEFLLKMGLHNVKVVWISMTLKVLAVSIRIRRGNIHGTLVIMNSCGTVCYRKYSGPSSSSQVQTTILFNNSSKIPAKKVESVMKQTSQY